MSYTEEGLNAARWCWKCLWQGPDQGSYAKVRLLDALQLSKQEGGLSGWLFTSLTDGTVKSKARQNWTSAKVTARCSGGTRTEEDGSTTTLMKAHVGLASNGAMQWRDLTSNAVLNLVTGGADGAIVCLAPVTGSHSFAEVVFEREAGAPAAKVTTFTMYNGSTLIEENHRKGLNYPTHSKVAGVPVPKEGERGKEEPTGGLPQHKLVCLSKEIVQQTKVFILDLVKQLESRGRVRLTRLSVVVLLEANPLDDEKVVWLHHCREASFNFRGSGGGGGGGGGDEEQNRQERQERRSNAGMSDLTHRTDASQAGAPRMSRCLGDFCAYDETDGSGGDGGRGGSSVADDSGDLKTEVRKALRRHHPDDKVAAELAQAQEAQAEEMKRMGARGDEGDEAATSTAAAQPATRTVPFKAIALARHEMSNFELEGRSTYDKSCMGAWTEELFYWWSRHGRAHSKVGGGALPASSAHFIGQSIAGVRPSSGDERVAMAERKFQANNGLDAASLASASKAAKAKTEAEAAAWQGQGQGHGGGRRPSHSSASLAHSTDDSHLLSASHGLGGSSGGGGGGSETGEANEILFDLQENHFTGYSKRSMGQVSWFYSGAKVCERCYSVYRDLDRRREASQLALLRKQRKAAQAGLNETLQGKEIERRIFEQRRFASRMSRNLRPAVGGEDEAKGLASHQHHGSSSSSVLVGAPKGVLPPLPWQLRDEQKRAEYESGSFGPAFVRNIRTKAQQMAALVQQDRLMERVRAKNRHLGAGGARLGGQLDQDSLSLAEEEASLAPDFDWRQVTGADRLEEQRRDQARQQAAQRKVIGGLGENRPKPKSKDFDPERLMHGWQRDMEKWREHLRAEHGENYNHTGLAAQNEAGRSLKEKNRAVHEQRTQRLAEKGLSSHHNNHHQATAFAPPGGGGGGAHTHFAMGGSTISQLTLDQSMYDPRDGALQGQGSVDSLSGLDDDEWIRRVIGKPKNAIDVAPKPARTVSFGPNAPNVSTKADFTLQVDKGQSHIHSHRAGVQLEDDDEDDDEDDEGEGIGWSPFVIPG